MVDQSNEPSYVPVLKWRGGEKLALSNLEMNVRSKIIPLLELVNDEGDNPEDLTRDITSNWGGTVYMDVHYRPRIFAYRALDNLINHIDGLDIIPVVRLDAPPLLIEALKKVAMTYKNGIAIRIIVEAKNDFLLLQQEVDLLLKQMSLGSDPLDLIIDFRYLEDSKKYETTLKKLAKSINLNPWRRVIVSAGTFPADLTNFRPNEENILERSEWKLWEANKEILGRQSVYSDYTVRFAPYLRRNTPGSISVRYTLDDKYQVFRGKQDDKSFKYLVHAMNIRALYGKKFNASFSWGDQFIDERAKQLEDCLKRGEKPEEYEDFTPGNFADWVGVSVNHHICVVVKDNLRV